MNDFFDSKFMSDLKAGQLPAVTVKIDSLTIAQLGVMIVVAGLILALIKSKLA